MIHGNVDPWGRKVLADLRCSCGRATDHADRQCAPCAAMEACYGVFCNIFETFPNQFEIVQQCMRWPWTMHEALNAWARAQDQAEKADGDRRRDGRAMQRNRPNLS